MDKMAVRLIGVRGGGKDQNALGRIAMPFGGVILGIIYAIIVGVVLVLAGAIIAWLAAKFGWPIDSNVQNLYMLLVLLVVVYMILATVFGLPMPFRP